MVEGGNGGAGGGEEDSAIQAWILKFFNKRAFVRMIATPHLHCSEVDY